MSDPEDKPISREQYFRTLNSLDISGSVPIRNETNSGTDALRNKSARGMTPSLLYVDDYGGFDLPTPNVDNRKIVIFNFGGSGETPEPNDSIRYIGKIWVRPVLPSKRNGRKGTRKGWKRRNPPKWKYFDFDDLSKITLVDDNGKLDLSGLADILRDIAVPPPSIAFSFVEKIPTKTADFLRSWSRFLNEPLVKTKLEGDQIHVDMVTDKPLDIESARLLGILK